MRKEVKILFFTALLVITAAAIGTYFYQNSVQNERITETGNSSQDAAKSEALIRSDSQTLGRADAPVTIVEFLDPECESCAAFAPTVKKMLQDYNGKVRLVVRYMPLHPNSLSAATFTEAAGEQGKYWQAQELLFQRQPEWGTKHGPNTGSPTDINALFRKYAGELGLDINKMNAAFSDSRYQSKIQRDYQDGQTLGVRQTPTLFVNGKRLFRLGESELRFLIDDELRR